MTLYDALSNWVQLKLVYDHRPQDEAAKVSLEHVEEILQEEYHVTSISEKREEGMYSVSFLENGEEKTQIVPSWTAETLLRFIMQNPEHYDVEE